MSETGVGKGPALDEVHRAIGIMLEAHARRRQRVEAIRSTGAKLGDLYAAHASEARRELALVMAQHAEVGWPPSFVRVAGQSSLEKPFNRLLAWLCQGRDHGLEFRFLQRLATVVDLEVMASDLEEGEPVEMRFEQTFSDDPTKEPDVVIHTRRAALLLENKVHAGESGDQYGPYQRLFEEKYQGLSQRLVLCSRRPREVPIGWRLLLHREIAELLRELGQDESLSFWGRVSAVIAASAFDDDRGPRELEHEARRLLDLDRPTPAEVARMRELSRTVDQLRAPRITHRSER